MERKNVSVVYDRRKRFEKTGKGKLEIMVYFGHNSRKYITVADATPANWEFVAQSAKVREMLRDCERILDAMDAIGEDRTPENFNTHFQKKEKIEASTPNENLFNGVDQNSSFLDYMKDCIDAEDLAPGSRKNKLVVLAALREFGKFTKFKDITLPGIILLNDWLLMDGTRSVPTVYGYHKKIKMYVTRLYESGMIPCNPYNQKTFPRGSYKERRPLSEDELVRIRTAVLEGKMDRARDLFIFAAYTGLSYCDAMAFDFKIHTEKVGDMYYIDGSRIKTGALFFTPILPPAMDVLKKYNFKLPYVWNQHLNDYLHLVEAKLEFNKPLTYHVARHSFATLSLSHDIPIEHVARMMGHKEIRTTQIYAKVLKSTIERHASQMAAELK